MKICTKCGVEKPLSEFSTDKSKKDGHYSSCKTCKKQYDKQYVVENKSYVYSRNHEYNKQHRHEKALYDKHRRDAIRDAINKKKREYYHSTGKQVGAAWNKSNSDKLKTYAFNKAHKRRLQVADSSLTSKEIHIWKQEQVLLCVYCGIDCTDNYHIDHVTPLSKGGTHSLDNLAISCPFCNISKGNKSLLIFLTTRQIDRS